MRLVVVAPLLLLSTALAAVHGATLANDAFTADLQPDGGVVVTARDGAHAIFRPAFTIIARSTDPGMRQTHDADYNLVLPKWRTQADSKETTFNLFAAGVNESLVASAGVAEPGRITWTFPAGVAGTLGAELALPAGSGEPVLSFRFAPRTAGWYSIAYSGAPCADPAAVEAIWQPRIWQEKRFPNQPLLSTEIACSLPATLVSQGGTTVGVAVDPDEIPFRMPVASQSRFGVAVRNAAGQAQPQVLAPVLGFPGSRLEVGADISFRLRLSVRAGGWYDSFRHLSTALFGFRDQRESTVCTLNQTLEHMIDFAMHSPYSGWDEELKGCDYTTDVKDTVKIVSALHPLSLAILTDDEAIFTQRARPMVEFLLSREKYLYGRHPGISEQNPSHRMAGPGGEAFEWSSLYRFTQERTPAFLATCRERHQKPKALNLDTLPPDIAWISSFAMWQATGLTEHLDEACRGADAYIAKRITTPQSDFKASNLPGSGQFPTDFVPRWMVLFNLFEATGERRFLDAAVSGARLHAAWCWMYPTIPTGMVTVNQGGLVKGLRSPAGDLTQAEATVPAWWVAPQGLAPEASNTYTANPAVLLANHAPWMLRLAQASGEDFLRVVARNALVGRYANYPGYTINRVFSTVNMQADYPTRAGDPYHRYNQMYLNHVWPQIAVVADWLFSEAETRSAGRIRFPSRYAQGYVYLQSRVYGDRPGRFYDDEGVRPYLPPGLVTSDQLQVNHIAGHGNGQLYVALCNQSAQAITATITLDAQRLKLEAGRTYHARLWCDNQPCAAVELRDGRVTVPLSAQGITALAIAGITVSAPFQERIFDTTAKPLTDRSQQRVEGPFGAIRATVMDFGRGLSSGYIFLAADETMVSVATLHWRLGDGAWQERPDPVYPYEFTVPMADDGAALEWWVEARTADGGSARTALARLEH